MAIVDQSQIQGSTLGYAQITSNFSTSSTSAVQVTGLTATVTIPSGGRRVKITAFCPQIGLSSQGFAYLSIWDGTVGSGTQLNFGLAEEVTGLGNMLGIAMAIVTPPAGSKTYNVGLSVNTGTATMTSSSTGPSFILVELI